MHKVKKNLKEIKHKYMSLRLISCNIEMIHRIKAVISFADVVYMMTGIGLGADPTCGH